MTIIIVRCQEMLRLYKEKKRAVRAAYIHQAQESKRAWYEADKRHRRIIERETSSLFADSGDGGVKLGPGDKPDAPNNDGNGYVGGAKNGCEKSDCNLKAITNGSMVGIHFHSEVSLIGQSESGGKVGPVEVIVAPSSNAVGKSVPNLKTGKCVVVRKGKPNDPLTTERSNSNIIVNVCPGTDSVDEVVTLNRVEGDRAHVTRTTVPSNGEGDRAHATIRTLPTHNAVSVKQAVSPMANERTRNITPRPNSLISPKKNMLPPIRFVSNDQFNSQVIGNDQTTTNLCAIQSEINPDKEVVSLVKLIKQRRKEREKERKRILDRENVPIYTKTRSGEVSSTMLSFHRKQFNPPSQKESYFRFKMLRAQEEARRLQRDRLEAFFEKIRIEGQFLGHTINQDTLSSGYEGITLFVLYSLCLVMEGV